MAAEVSSDVTFINDEDVLRRMWQQTEDFGRKKEIRARMYKLREQRLRDFYTTGEVVNDTLTSRKHTATTHADSISDQGFLTMKTKEIRDSESPTRDIQRRTCDTNYWNTIQDTSYSIADDANTISDSYTLNTTGQGVSQDGNTKMNLAAQEKGFQSSTVLEDDNSRSASEKKGMTTEISSSSHTKTDDGGSMSTTSKQHTEQTSTRTVSSNKDANFSSSKWETSSTSSSSSRRVISSSNYEVTGSRALSDTKAITSSDSDYKNISDIKERETKDFDQSLNTRNVSKTSVEQESRSKINETHSSVISNESHLTNIKDRSVDSRNDNVATKIYTTELTSNVKDYNVDHGTRKIERDSVKTDVENVVVDQKIMTELHKLDSFLSTQHTGTSTPVSPHSTTSDATNWTVVSNTDGEFVYKGDKVTRTDKPEPQQPKRELIKQPSSLDLPKDTTEGQYVTTYQEHYTNKRISVDNSPTHDAFARSLRQSPPASRSSSKVSLDRSSPERKSKSPRASPDKERRVSVGSYTIETQKRKSSDVSRQSAKDTKTKRKFSTTQTKATAKNRASTPGASPDTSPTRQQRGRTTSPSSQSDSDASQITYDKTDSSTIKRTDVTRRKLVDSFQDENIIKTFEETDAVVQTRRPSQDTSPVKSPQDGERKITSILRKESKTDVDSESIQTKQSNIVASHLRTTSPEYSSEGSVGKEILIKKSSLKKEKQTPDSSPERSAFTPIKSFRTSPEVHSYAPEVIINTHHFGSDTREEVIKEREPTKPTTPIPTRKPSTPDSGMQSPNSDISRKTPSPSKHSSPYSKQAPSSPSEVSRRPSSPGKQSRTNITYKTETLITRAASPTKETSLEISLARPKEDHFKKEPIGKSRPESPTKDTFRIKSAPKEEPTGRKEPSPTRKLSSPQKDFTKRPQSPQKSSSPTRRSPLRNEPTDSSKVSKPDTYSRPTHPSKTEKTPVKFSSPDRSSKSSSVSPCSSPERSSPNNRKVNAINVTPIHKPIPKRATEKTFEETKQTVRTTRRSSIPRADQTTVKKFESKIEVRSKGVTKIPSIDKRVTTASPQSRPVRPSSQASPEKQPVKNYKTTIKQTVDKPREVIKKTPVKTVKTTAIITIEPSKSTQVKKTTSSISRINQTVKKTGSKDSIVTKVNQSPATDKRTTNISKTKTIEVSHRSLSSSPETVPADTVLNKTQTIGFIEHLKQEDTSNILPFVCKNDLTDRTINIEFIGSNIEDETLPEFPDTELDEEVPKSVGKEISEKTMQVEGKRQTSNTFTVTVKKPTVKSTTTSRNITTRSSSGPIKPSTQARPTTPSKKPTTNIKKETYTRSVSDKSIKTPPKRLSSKPELSKPINKAAKPVTETGIATRSVTSAKTTVIKRNAPIKKSEKEISSSEDEEDIPNVVNTHNKEESYIQELEQIRREEEEEYASKVTNKENMLLNVIVQHPKSSRESSPDFPSRGQPFCTVSDDGGSQPRLADMVTEPEDVEVFDKNTFKKAENFVARNELVTDLDEESETEDVKLEVSVADRVSQFIETTKNINSTTVREESFAPVSSAPKSVLKAKNMFESIAKNQMAPPAPNNKPVDILSRPSVFEGRRGETVPKIVSLECIAQTDRNFEETTTYEASTDVNEQLHIDIDETMDVKLNSINKIKETDSSPVHSPNYRTPSINDIPSPVQKSYTPEKPKPKEQIKETPIRRPSQERKAPLTPLDSNIKNSERVIQTSSEISSKKAFFERKAQAQHTPTKEPFKKGPSIKSARPQPKEPSPDRKNADFIDNEKRASKTTPERKTSAPTSPTKERKPSLKSTSPDRFDRVLSTKENQIDIESKTIVQNKKVFSRDSSEKTLQTDKSLFNRDSPDRSLPKEKPTNKRDSPVRQVLKDTKLVDRTLSEKSFAKESRTTVRQESPERTLIEGRRPTAAKDRPTTNRESPERSPVKDKKSPERSPVKDRRLSAKTSPDRSPIKDRRSSFNEVSPDRSQVKDRRPSGNRASPDRSQINERRTSATMKDRRSSTRDSPDRTSPRRDVDVPELNKAGKFGVTLRRTSSTGSGCTLRRSSIPGEAKEIEEIHELELLEQLMEKAVGYEQRRRIRSQIRVVKKSQEDKVSKSYRTTATTKTPTSLASPAKEPSKFDKSPQKVSPTSKPAEYIPSRPASPTKPAREASPEYRRQPLTNGYHKPETKRKESPDRKSPVRKQDTSSQLTETVRKGSKTETNVEITTVRTQTQKRTETLQEQGVDSITSSYGVGPTDENGRPLFGLRALRRTNTNKALTDEQEISIVQPEPEVCDARGRPLFGLKALRTNLDAEEMPEQPSAPQLKDLVQKHEKKAHDVNHPEREPVQKPKAKLRDSFIDQNEEEHRTNALEEFNSSQRGLSLKSIIQKHENIGKPTGTVKQEMSSSTTVVSSKSTVSSDGSVSFSRDVLKGELSSRNGEEPTGKVTRTEYSYKSPSATENDKAISKVTTTTRQIGSRRVSGPSITEVEDDYDIKSNRRTSFDRNENEESLTKSYTTSRRSSQKDETEYKSSISRVSGQRITDEETNESFDENTNNKYGKNTTTSKVVTNVRRFSSPKIKDEEGDVRSTSRTTTTTKRTESSQSQKQDKEEYQSEEKKKGLVRGDSVRALQHKFQQATVSSKQKQTALDKSRQSPEKQPSTIRNQASESTVTSSSRVIENGDAHATSECQRTTSMSRVTETSTTTNNKTSFLDNKTRVTGVQDILNRMRNADLVVESEDTTEDTEARALLNKFLGASVILQGMEQGMKASGIDVESNNITPGSAALVSRVEKQRMATSTRKSEEDIENIWDEKQLRILLEACSDYEERRQIRARLRTVMAEHKESESKQVMTGGEGSTVTRTEVHTRTVSTSNRLTKAQSVTSPFAKFKQLERQNSVPSSGSAPLFKFTDPKLVRSASTIKERLLNWVQAQTKEYKNIQIDNFSTSWSNGLAFCALIHHFCPDAFDYDKLTPDQRRHNFELAFRVAEEEAGIAPLLDVEDMVVMRRPDWKCVFTYVQSIYRRYHATPESVRY